MIGLTDFSISQTATRKGNSGQGGLVRMCFNVSCAGLHEVADRTFELLMKDHVGEVQLGFAQGQCLCGQKNVKTRLPTRKYA